jgi:hypothetical protein
VIDGTDRPDTRRRPRLAVIGATLALGLGALGAAATGAFAGGGDSTGSSTTGASTTFVQDGTTTLEQDAPVRGDCPEGAAPQDGGGTEVSSTTPS